MSDLLKKLNTLVKANLSDLTPNLPKFERSPNLDRQIAELRDRINSALEHEDKLQATANTLRTEVERLDMQADEAVAQGQDAQARYILEQMKRAQQRLDMAESDLGMHQRVAHELIQRVNLLEATVADSKAAQQEPVAPPSEAAANISAETPDETISESTESTPSAVQRISGILRQTQELARERINTMTDLINAQTETQQSKTSAKILVETEPSNITPREAPKPVSNQDAPSTPAPLVPEPSSESEAESEDPMERRLQRLSKPASTPTPPSSTSTSS